MIEKIFSQSQQFAREVLDQYGEPNSVVVIFNWEVGKADFPPGVLITREATMSPEEFSSIIGQVSKMMQRLMTINADQMAKLAESLDAKAAELVKKEATLNERTKTASASICES